MRTKQNLFLPPAVVRLAGVAVTLLALLAGPRVLAGYGQSANGPTAQPLYFPSLQRAISQPRFTLHSSMSFLAQEDLGGIGRMTDTYRLRYVRPGRMAVAVRRTGGLPFPLLRIVLANRRLCISSDSGDWSCSPAHPVLEAWYIQEYLLGGWVSDVHVESAHRVTAGQSTVTVRFVGRGVLGCTPAGSGAGTSNGYEWCRFGGLDRRLQRWPITGEMTIDARTGLPLRFRARGVGRLSPVLETATFSYGGRFRVVVPAGARHVPCSSWMPAVHCIELGKA